MKRKQPAAPPPVPVAKWVLAALASLWLAGIWLEAVGATRVTNVLPAPLKYFTQVAKLFPRAAEMVIEWRAQGFRCATGKFEEIDTRPHFPIRADDKENRFDRAMFFYHTEKKVLEALDAFLVRRENALGPDHRIGGTMLLSVRIPIPEPGSPEERYRRVPLEQIPRSIERKYWWVTPPAVREARCAP